MLLFVDERGLERFHACDMPETHYETIYFTGHVQGVGFRYTTLQISKEYDVTGFVKNLPDGRVLLELEGAPGQINAFVAAIHERMHGHIRSAERNSRRREAEFRGFDIR